MKKLTVFTMLFVLALTGNALAVGKTKVKGYFKKGGTYVGGHTRTSPNGKDTDNWSKKGNINPYTGKKGTK